ncbi:MAG: LacI family DNA-binding transcriptional regulator, partial [Alphaproteobacteria bacterium]
DLSRMERLSLYQAAKQLQTINAPALTIYAHARDQEKQVRRERNKKIAQLRSAGYRIQDIAKIAGVSPATVSRVLCAAKLLSQQQIKQSHPALAVPNFLT